MSYEKLGYRNLTFNIRRRDWGYSLTAMDIDFMEYHHKTGAPLAYTETKFGRVQEIDLNEPKITALCMTADAMNLPAYLIVYYPMDENGELLDGNEPMSKLAHIQFIIMGINELGLKDFPRYQKMSELAMATFLAKLHGVPLQPLKPLSNELKPMRVPLIFRRT